jgi:hypothetical protein
MSVGIVIFPVLMDIIQLSKSMIKVCIQANEEMAGNAARVLARPTAQYRSGSGLRWKPPFNAKIKIVTHCLEITSL